MLKSKPGRLIVAFSLFLLAGFASGLAHAQGARNTELLDYIVAVVEEDVILRSELDRAMASVIQQFSANGQPLPSRNVLERQVLERLALTRLQLQRADQTGIRISDQEIDVAIQNVSSQAGITIDQMQRTIAADGLSWEQFRNDMRDELKTQQLRRRIANSRVNISESEIDIFLQSNPINRGEYRLSHILIGVPEGASPQQIQQAAADVQRIHADLLSGEMDFSTAAITHSDGQNALQGGDLGWRPGSEVPTLFAEQVAGMQPGDLTRPMRSASGFHILKVTDYRAASARMVREMKARHIMVEVSELVTPQEALDIVTNVHERIENGEDFGELARQFSDDPNSANLGGDLGWFSPGQFGTRVQQTLDSLEEGELSQPFQTQAGWHIMELVDVREQDRSEEIMRNQARDALRRQKSEEELLLWERQLRDESFIEYRLPG